MQAQLATNTTKTKEQGRPMGPSKRVARRNSTLRNIIEERTVQVEQYVARRRYRTEERAEEYEQGISNYSTEKWE